MKHAVFVQLVDADRFGVEDHTIHVFNSEEAATSWIVERLIQAGEIKRLPDGRLVYGEEGYELGDESDAIEQFQGGLNMSGYFHRYPVVEH